MQTKCCLENDSVHFVLWTDEPTEILFRRVSMWIVLCLYYTCFESSTSTRHRTSSRCRWLGITKLLLWSTQTKKIEHRRTSSWSHTRAPQPDLKFGEERFSASFTRCVNALPLDHILDVASDTHVVLTLFAQSFLVIDASNASQSNRVFMSAGFELVILHRKWADDVP